MHGLESEWVKNVSHKFTCFHPLHLMERFSAT
jgi:hypothetical protein